MALALYRRHRRDCKAAHPEQLHTSEFEERKKGYRRCDCPIVASGTLAGRFRRQSTGTWDWDTAKALLAALETAGVWDAQKPKPSQPPIAAASDPRRITILEATEAYMATCKHRGLQPSSLSKYRTSINQLTAYSDSRGYVLLDQLTVADMDRFYASWKDGKRAGAKKLARLKAFVKFCRKRKWLTDDITEDLQPQQGSSIPANKTPFTDEELSRIYAACDVLGGPKPPGPGAREWTGSDLQTFIMLSVYTGLRISDVATFNTRERLEGNDVFLRMHKTRKPLFTWILMDAAGHLGRRRGCASAIKIKTLLLPVGCPVFLKSGCVLGRRDTESSKGKHHRANTNVRIRAFANMPTVRTSKNWGMDVSLGSNALEHRVEVVAQLDDCVEGHTRMPLGAQPLNHFRKPYSLRITCGHF
jgi:hypothetical protein